MATAERWAAPALAGALLYLATGLHPVWWLVPLAPVPVLWLAPRVPPAVAALAAFVAWLAGTGNMVAFYREAYAVPWPVIAVVSVVPSLAFTAVVIGWRAILLRGWSAAAIAFLPAAWVAYELLVARVSPHGSLWSLAYTQVDCLPLLQLAAWLGAPAISFAVLLASAALASLARKTRRGPVVAIAVLAAAIVASALRLAASAPPADRTRVALAAIDQPFPETPAASDAALAAYLPLLQRARGADIVVLPELVATLASEADPALDRVRAAAAAGQVAVLLGVHLDLPDGRRNAAILLAPDGRTLAVYHKQHLVPGLEDHYRPGGELAVAGAWGVAICKDLDFATPSREYGARGVGLLLAPAWDKGSDGWLHARMAIVRGVEYGFTLARSAREGRLLVSDDHGRVVAEAASDPRGALLVADVAPVARTTLYRAIGDSFAWLCVFYALGALALTRRRRGGGGS